METYSCWTLGALAERLGIDESDVFTHRLETLLSHLPETLQQNMRSEKHVWHAFASEVNTWRPAWRYDARPMDVDRGRGFLEATDVVFKWLNANRA
jgi:arylsulfatase A-like enzyme